MHLLWHETLPLGNCVPCHNQLKMCWYIPRHKVTSLLEWTSWKQSENKRLFIKSWWVFIHSVKIGGDLTCLNYRPEKWCLVWYTLYLQLLLLLFFCYHWHTNVVDVLFSQLHAKGRNIFVSVIEEKYEQSSVSDCASPDLSSSSLNGIGLRPYWDSWFTSTGHLGWQGRCFFSNSTSFKPCRCVCVVLNSPACHRNTFVFKAFVYVGAREPQNSITLHSLTVCVLVTFSNLEYIYFLLT